MDECCGLIGQFEMNRRGFAASSEKFFSCLARARTIWFSVGAYTHNHNFQGLTLNFSLKSLHSSKTHARELQLVSAKGDSRSPRLEPSVWRDSGRRSSAQLCRRRNVGQGGHLVLYLLRAMTGRPVSRGEGRRSGKYRGTSCRMGVGLVRPARSKLTT